MDNDRRVPTREEIEDAEGKKWLRSEQHWTNRVGQGWVAKRILGRGAQGIVGHWTYEGPERDRKRLVDVVVKQASARSGEKPTMGLLGEAATMRNLNTARSPHILRMFRQIYVDQGQDTNFEFDVGKVHRIFLEYCPGGDLMGWQKKKKEKQEISEAEMWAIFHCFALGALVMHHGNEDARILRWSDEICHFDVKQENSRGPIPVGALPIHFAETDTTVLLGAVTTDEEHQHMPIFKIADFGIALNVPPVQNMRYHNTHEDRGTMSFILPEQIQSYDFPFYKRPWLKKNGSKIRNLRYGSKSNVWQIGLIMWCLKHKQLNPNWRSVKTYYSKMSHNLIAGGETLGLAQDIQEELEHPDLHSTYSMSLRILIKECLLIQSDGRPTPESLVRRTRRGLDIIRMSAGTITTTSPIDSTSNHPEPPISARWNLGQRRPRSFAARPALSSQRTRRPAKILAIIQEAERGAERNGVVNQTLAQQIRTRRFQQFEALQSANQQTENPPAMNSNAAAPSAGQMRMNRRDLDMQQHVAPANTHLPPNAPTSMPTASTATARPNDIPGPQNAVIPQLHCIIQRKDLFGNIQHRAITLHNLHWNMTFSRLMDMLIQLGCPISKQSMRIYNGRSIFMVQQMLSELGGNTSVRVKDVNEA